MSTLTAVSLFAGVGGFDLALERAGVEVVAAVEIDKAARGVLADQFPKTTLFNDVTKVTGDDLRRAGFVPERGIITAGWPCQGNSVAGPRGGMDDPRSGLWREVVRLLAETRARWFVGENVPGLLTVNDGDDIGVVRADLAQLGYWHAERILDAQYFGVPQRRRRVFFVGCLADAWRPVQVLLEPEGRARDSAAGNAARAGAAEDAGYGLGVVGEPGGVANVLLARDSRGPIPESGIGNLVVDPGTVVSTLQAGGGRPGLPDRRRSSSGRSPRGREEVVMALTCSGVSNPDDNSAQAGHIIAVERERELHTFQKVVRSGARDVNGNLPPEVWAEREVAATLNCGDNTSESRATELIVQPLALRGREGGAQLEIGAEGAPYNALRAGDGGSSRQSLVAITGEVTHTLTSEGSDASEDGTGRGTPIVAFSHTAGMDCQPSSSVAPTMKAGHDTMPSVSTETTVRRLTPMECERLQGFPDDWTRTSNGREQADSPRYKQMGNAVAVPVVEWIMRRIVEVDS